MNFIENQDRNLPRNWNEFTENSFHIDTTNNCKFQTLFQEMVKISYDSAIQINIILILLAALSLFENARYLYLAEKYQYKFWMISILSYGQDFGNFHRYRSCKLYSGGAKYRFRLILGVNHVGFSCFKTFWNFIFGIISKSNQLWWSETWLFTLNISYLFTDFVIMMTIERHV